MHVTTLLGISMLVLTTILIYTVFSFRKILENLIQKMGTSSPAAPSHDLSKVKEELKEVQECIFFQKYANIPFTKFRTVTLSNAILQASKSKDAAFPISSKRITKVGNQNVSSPIPIESLNYPTNLRQFETDENNYESNVSGILGYNKLGEACYCPGGRICDWEPGMFTQFVYNTEIIDLDKIEIYKKEGDGYQLISTSNIQPEPSPSGQYAMVIMDNPIEIQSVPPEVELILVIYWRDSGGQLQVVALKNVLENPEEVEAP